MKEVTAAAAALLPVALERPDPRDLHPVSRLVENSSARRSVGTRLGSLRNASPLLLLWNVNKKTKNKHKSPEITPKL